MNDDLATITDYSYFEKELRRDLVREDLSLNVVDLPSSKRYEIIAEQLRFFIPCEKTVAYIVVPDLYKYDDTFVLMVEDKRYIPALKGIQLTSQTLLDAPVEMHQSQLFWFGKKVQ